MWIRLIEHVSGLWDININQHFKNMDLDLFTAKAKTIMKQGNNWYVMLQTILLAHFSDFLYLEKNSNRKIMKKQAKYDTYVHIIIIVLLHLFQAGQVSPFCSCL